MNDQLDKLEQVFGGKIERAGDRVIPGMATVPGREVIYFSDDGSNPPRTQFQNLTRKVNPPHLKSGGATEQGCVLRLPDGTAFHAMSYHGDIDGWRKQIDQGAQELGLLTARVSEQKFLVSDGREFNLADCKVEFI